MTINYEKEKEFVTCWIRWIRLSQKDVVSFMLFVAPACPRRRRRFSKRCWGKKIRYATNGVMNFKILKPKAEQVKKRTNWLMRDQCRRLTTSSRILVFASENLK